jgi:hypothetical protein
LYSQILICASLVVAAYQDVKRRSVYDLVWLPALAGAFVAAILMYPNLELFVVKIAIVGGIALIFALLGYLGQADAIAMAFVACDPYPISPVPPLFAAAVIALSHIGYEYLVGNARGTKTIPIERFLNEQRWIPKAVLAGGKRTVVSKDVNVAREEVSAQPASGASVEVTYGVPTVAYLGAGYAVYLLYLLISNTPLLLSLP